VVNLGSVAFHEYIDGEGSSFVCASAGALLEAEVEQACQRGGALDGRASDDVTQQQSMRIMAGCTCVGNYLAKNSLRTSGCRVADDAGPTNPSCHGAGVLDLDPGDLSCGEKTGQSHVVRSVGVRA